MANANGWGDGASNNNIGWGKGADNAIGWGDIHANSWAGLTDIVGAPSTDPDAQAFITAASITDPTQQSAINTLVTDLKGYNIWTKMKALYPFVGGTASTHKWNLKDPRDLDAAFRLVFSGGWTHSSTGALPNGTNAYANTYLDALSTLSSTSYHLSYYSRTQDTSKNAHDMGAEGFSDTNLDLYLYYNSVSAKGFLDGTYPSLAVQTNNTDTTGFQIGNRTSIALMNLWWDGSKLATNTTTDNRALPSLNIFIGATNTSGSGTAFSNRQTAFASIGDGLTDTEAANFYTAVQTFQTTLGRSIGTQTVSDADAQAFVTNAGIVDQVEANAVNNLVIGLKADGLWTKMKAVYPMVGGTSTTTSYNLRNTAQYQITWNGGVTHSSNGVLFNGTNSYGDTNLNTSSILTPNNLAISVYTNTNRASSSGIIYGNSDNTTSYIPIIELYLRFGVNNIYSDLGDYNFRAASTNINTAGYYIATRIASNSSKLFKNNSLLAQNTNTQTTNTLPNTNIYLGTFNYNNGAIVSSNVETVAVQIFTLSDGLTDTDATNLNTRVTTFQTALNRNV